MPRALRRTAATTDSSHDHPNTRQQPQHVNAVMRRMYPEDIEDYLQGKGVSVFTKRVRLEVVDFYQTVSGVTA